MCSYEISLGVIEYQTAILRDDLDTAASLSDNVPQDQRNRVARFLESQGRMLDVTVKRHVLNILLCRYEGVGAGSFNGR